MGKCSSHPAGEVDTGDEHVEAVLIAEAWSRAVLTVRLAIMALGSSVQREEKKCQKEMTRINERNHFCSKRLNSILPHFQKELSLQCFV